MRILRVTTICVVLSAGAALAQPCDVIANGGAHYPSLTSALAALPDRDGNHLQVSGVCQEKASVLNHVNLRIDGTPGARLEPPPATTEPQPQTLNIRTSDTVTVRNLTIRGKADVCGAVSIWQSREVTFSDVTMETGSSPGAVWVVESFNVSLQNAVIQNSDDGIRVDGPAQVVLQGAWNPNQSGTAYLQNNVTGATMIRGAVLSLRGDTLVRNNNVGVSANGGGLFVCCFEDTAHPRIENNAVYGAFMRGGDVQIQSPLIVQGNGFWGLVLIGTQARMSDALIRTNGPPQRTGGGIIAIGGLLDVTRGEISANQGPGILVSDGATGRLSSAQITGNAGEGVDVQGLSVVSIFGGSVRDNRGFDLRCAPNSFGRGSADGVEKLHCGGFDQSPDPTPGGKE